MLYSSEELKNMCTVVVCSCDKYDDIWDPFFLLYKKNCFDFLEYKTHISHLIIL